MLSPIHLRKCSEWREVEYVSCSFAVWDLLYDNCSLNLKSYFKVDKFDKFNSYFPDTDEWIELKHLCKDKFNVTGLVSWSRLSVCANQQPFLIWETWEQDELWSVRAGISWSGSSTWAGSPHRVGLETTEEEEVKYKRIKTRRITLRYLGWKLWSQYEISRYSIEEFHWLY